jgi:hypothetical protein
MPTPDATTGEAFRDELRAQLAQCHYKIRHCVGQLSQDQLWHRAGESFNSIGNLVLHVTGNLRQRFLAVIGGEPDQRNRDAEFAERRSIPAAELLAGLDDVVVRIDGLLAALAPQRMLETRRYRMLRGDVENSVLGIAFQTIVHVAGHTQEIIALTRLQLGERYQFLEGRKP